MIVEDISLGGLKFINYDAHELQPGAIIHLSFTLDDGKGTVINKEDKVKSVEKNAIGLNSPLNLNSTRSWFFICCQKLLKYSRHREEIPIN